MIDVNKLRDMEIRLHRHDKADEVYTFYYDETNNIRRLRVTPSGLNVQNPQCYVLGGIVHQGPIYDFGIETLRSALKIQKSASEIKLKYLGKGEFLNVLESDKIRIFLEWMDCKGLFIHYQVLDVIYWSIVDIIDSIITELKNPQLMTIAPALKSDLYTILRSDLDDTVRLFQRYCYPDVGRDRRSAFIRELQNLLGERCHLLPHINFQMLKGVLELASDLESLLYLEDEKPNILLDEFSMFYIKNICLFKNSTHILDIEEDIETRLKAQTFMDNGRLLQNYRFVDSKQEAGVQIADVAVGLLGKFFTFINRTRLCDLRDARSTLSPIQLGNLSQLTKIMDLSVSENSALALRVLSYEDEHKAAFFFGE